MEIQSFQSRKWAGKSENRTNTRTLKKIGFKAKNLREKIKINL
jgi:hypothetical protein